MTSCPQNGAPIPASSAQDHPLKLRAANIMQATFPSSDADIASSWHTVDCWALDGATGRRFAALNGDRNPIHVSATLAQLFGFRSCVAHGMLLLARSVISIQNAGALCVWASVLTPIGLPEGPKGDRPLACMLPQATFAGNCCRATQITDVFACCAGVRTAYPTVIEAEFRRPCFLPGTMECLVRGAPNAASAILEGSVDFAVVPQGLDVSKQVVRGRVGFCQPNQTGLAGQETK